MRKIFSLLIALSVIRINPTMGAEAGMPQLNPEFWIAQVFWLVFIFSILYLIIWKLALPRIVNNIENRRKHIMNDLDDAQKLKEDAEKKLTQYNETIGDARKEAKKIILQTRKKLESDINKKKEKFENEVGIELTNAEKQIKKFQESSVKNINKIAVEISSEIIKNILESEVNGSNISAIVEDISKNKIKVNL